MLTNVRRVLPSNAAAARVRARLKGSVRADPEGALAGVAAMPSR